MSLTLSSEERISLFDASEIPDSFPAKPILEKGTQHYFDNIKTTMKVLQIDDFLLPLTINDAEFQNSYVCSPYGHFVSYAYDQMQLIKDPRARAVTRTLIKGLDRIAQKASLNKTVIVNNNLYSTVLHPSFTAEQICEITNFLVKRFPDHAILFRSVSPNSPNGCYSALKQADYDFIPGRIVYMTDTKDPHFLKARMFASDLKVLRQSPYRILRDEEISLNQIPRLKQLYDLLNIEKYSKLNPQFNHQFFSLALEKKLLNFLALEHNGSIDAVVGFYEQNGMITSPLFGYDTSLSRDLGLYRQISTLLLLEAKEKKLLLNGSGGAGSYKKLRRALPVIESYGVYANHLKTKQRTTWRMLGILMQKIGIRFMQYFEK